MYKQLIIDTCKRYGLSLQEAAYVLATADWETNHTFEPVKEAYWVKNAEAWRKKNLRYYPWYGRGFVQLTWEKNYIKAGKELGLDLTTNPDKAMEPNIAAKVLVVGMKEGWFTGKKLADYTGDYHNARRIINGLDKANDIAVLANGYEAELKATYGLTVPQMPQVKEEQVSGTTPLQRLLSLVVSILRAFFGKRL